MFTEVVVHVCTCNEYGINVITPNYDTLAPVSSKVYGGDLIITHIYHHNSQSRVT